MNERPVKHSGTISGLPASDAPAPALPQSTFAPWLLTAVLCTVQVLDVLGTTFLIVALPSVQADMRLSAAVTELLAGVFALCFGALLVPSGVLADTAGAKLVLLAGLALFVVASLTGGLASGPLLLFGGRALQGVSAALAVPAALSILTAVFPEGPRRSRALGIWTAAGAAGGMAGFAAGGLVTDLLGWRWIFLLNVPIALIAFALVAWLAPTSDAGKGRRHVPLHSPALLVGGLLAIVIGLTRLRTAGDTSQIVWSGAYLVGGMALLALFVRFECSSIHPLIPRRLRRLPTVIGASAVAGGLTFTTTTAAVILSLYLQHIHQLSPTQAGLILAPGNVAIVLGSLVGSRLVGRGSFGSTMTIGLLLIAFALALCVVGLRLGSLAWIVAGLVANGLGLGSASVASTACGLSQAEARERGTASGLITTAAMLGTATGISVLGGIADLWTRLRTDDGSVSRADLTSGYGVALAVACAVSLALVMVARWTESARH